MEENFTNEYVNMMDVNAGWGVIWRTGKGEEEEKRRRRGRDVKDSTREENWE